MRYVLHTDGDWELSHDDQYEILKYWLDHRCPDSDTEEHRFYQDIDTPCSECGSVAPAGLQGMYLTLAVL